MEIVLITQITEQLPGQSVQITHNIQGEVPFPITRPIDLVCKFQRIMIIKPIEHSIVLFLVQFHLNRLQRFHLHNFNYLPIKYYLRNREQVLHRQMAEISFS